ncbi:hypothetical protein ID866_12966 [Astraeus odoratus]|nr:hypothetical protein ID866_12966 [Astraeus odoratus]
MLARAIQNLALQEPDMFNSSDPKKLCTFLVQCELNFQDRPHTFRNDRTKVTFAQSYLKGMVLQWFEPDLLSDSDPDDRPLWMDNWKEFHPGLQSKQTYFGQNPEDQQQQL